MAKVPAAVSLLLSCLLLWQPASSRVKTCQETSPCVFQCQAGSGESEWLDLNSFKPTQDMQPVFYNVRDSIGQNLFSFSPCSDFIEGVGCLQGTAVCQVDILNQSNAIDVGNRKTAALTTNTKGGAVSLTYTNQWKGVAKTSVVTLTCKEGANNTLTVQGENPAGTSHYLMALEGKGACFQNVAPTTHVSPTDVTTPSHNVTSPEHVTTHEMTTSAHHTSEVTTHEMTTVHNVTHVITTAHHNVTHVTTTSSHVTSQGHVTSEAVTTAGVVTTAGGTTGGSVTGTTPQTSTPAPGGQASKSSVSLALLLLLPVMGKLAF